jgi:hypothetical protein
MKMRGVFWSGALGFGVAGRVGRSGDWPVRRDEVERAGKAGDALADKQAVALGDLNATITVILFLWSSLGADGAFQTQSTDHSVAPVPHLLSRLGPPHPSLWASLQTAPPFPQPSAPTPKPKSPAQENRRIFIHPNTLPSNNLQHLAPNCRTMHPICAFPPTPYTPTT